MAHVFVDVSNVASIRKGERGYAPWNDVMLVCEAWLERHAADNMVLVADWGFHGYLQHNFVDEFPSYARARDAKQVRFAKSGKSAMVIEAPENIAADELLLKRAARYPDRQIIAEDHYRPYRDDYPWLQGFELQLPVIEGQKVRFEALYLRPIDEYEIEVAEAADEEKREMLETTRATRRNRHQRRRAARSAPVSGIRAPSPAPGRPGQPIHRPPVPATVRAPRKTSRATPAELRAVSWSWVLGVLVAVVAGCAALYVALARLV